VLYPVKQLDHF